MSHGAYIGIVIVLVLLLLIVFQLKRKMDEISDRNERRAEDHLRHPDEMWEPPIPAHHHPELEEAPPPPSLREGRIPTATPVPTTGPEAAPLPAAPQPLGPPDDLTRLKGLGPRAQARLNELGITRYDQLGALTTIEAERIDMQMGAFQGRLGRDRWIDQARLLASGDTATFEAEFGRLG